VSEANQELGLHWDLTKAVIGAFFVVRRELGPWFGEQAYVNALAVALAARGIASVREVPYEVIFHGVPVGLFRADLIAADRVLVEAKLADRIIPAHRNQVRNTLRPRGSRSAWC
jgi:GxxExxY protein